ncbi:non-ribosomal peptide synthetase [Streptomyces olivoreticuli]
MSGTGADFLHHWDHHTGRQPCAPALVEGSEIWTYGRTDARAEALAARLAAAGAGPGSVVGLALDRPREAVLAMLAVLKAQAAFTVLDPGLPPEPRAHLVREIDAALWLHSGPRPAHPLPSGTPRLDIAEGGDSAPPRRNLPVQDSRLAYILFTSGSTGVPKGVMIERGSLGGFAEAVRDRLALDAADRWLQVCSLGFDVVIEEVFPVLAAGGAVVCRPDSRPLEPEDLHRLLSDSASTVVELSTQYWREYARWLRAAGRTTPASLRTVLVGGERMDPAAYRDWQQRHPAAALVHVYGLTETTVTSTMYTGRLPEDADEVPIGSPLANALVTVRRDGRPVPLGEVGEIHIAGPSLARGFLHDERQTALRFRSDPAAPGARMYPTGDLGRRLPDGDLVFLGRRDAQLKVRGHRLEAAAVERALESGEAVAQAAVLLDPADDSSLVAALVPADRTLRPPAGAARRLTAAQRLRAVRPVAAALHDWAVPTRLYWVAELPKNPHGKIDTAALAALAGPAADAAPDPAAEAGDVPLRAVLHRFRTVLQAPSLGPDDDFFAHGGQSILAMRLVSELRSELPAAGGLRVSALFDCRTPRRLTERITGH